MTYAPAQPSTIPSMNRAIRVGLGPRLIMLVDLASPHLPGLTSDTAQFWVVIHEDAPTLGIAVEHTGTHKQYVIPVTKTSFTIEQIGLFRLILQMTGPEYSINR